MSQDFDPTDPSTWRGRGRSAEHAEAIAAAWRSFPDLPADAPLAERMNRGRERIAAMRPINDAIRDAAERERQATRERQESLELQRRSVNAQEQQAVQGQQRGRHEQEPVALSMAQCQQGIFLPAGMTRRRHGRKDRPGSSRITAPHPVWPLRVMRLPDEWMKRKKP